METGDIVKLYCRKCSKETNTEVIFAHRESWEADDGSVDGRDYYCVIKCRGCDYISFVEESYFSEDWDVRTNPKSGEQESFFVPKITCWPPKTARKKPNWIGELFWENPSLASLFEELYKCLDNDAHVAACISVRTIFDSISAHLKIDPANPFSKKLDSLVEKGIISGNEREALDILVDAGSAAAHRGWKPEVKQLNTVVDILEHFAERVLVLEKKAKELAGDIPAKPKKGA